MKKILNLFLFCSLLLSSIVNASTLDDEAAFKKVIKIDPVEVAVPSVVILVIPDDVNFYNFYVKDNEDNKFIGSQLNTDSLSRYEIKAPSSAYTEYSKELRFLAQPNHSYNIYFDADRAVSIVPSEIGNLKNNERTIVLSGEVALNDMYAPADIDGDGIRDIVDNCVQLANVEQQDLDKNGIGDACEDFDGDAVSNTNDNCPNHPNRNQTDADSDSIGDVCDEEESRITERSPWVPWVGMGMAGLVILILFLLVAQNTQPNLSNK